MAVFQRASVTQYGLQRMAQATTGSRMVFTSIGIGDEVLPNPLSETVVLTGEKQRFGLTDSGISNNNLWAMCEPQNIEDSDGIYVRSMGLYIAEPGYEADRSHDRLYAVTSIIPDYGAGPDYYAFLPQEAENTILDYKFAIHTIVSDEAVIIVRKIIVGGGHDCDLTEIWADQEKQWAKIYEIYGWMENLNNAIYSEVSENPFMVSFLDNSGWEIIQGVWNQTLARVEA